MFNIVFTDYTGSVADLSFLENDNWLNDAAVNYQLYQQKGRWKIKFHFIWIHHPVRLLCKYFKEEYESQKKVEIFANYYFKTIQKDKRSQLTINNNDYNICCN